MNGLPNETEASEHVEIEDQAEDFLTSGILKNSSKADKKLFSDIQDHIYKYSRRNSHEYTPLTLEYRVSSIAYCSRKILLSKNQQIYLSEEDVNHLPEWFLDEERDDGKPIFGSFTSGQFIHEVIQEGLKSHVLGMEKEVSLKIGNAKLIGHYDLLMEDENGEKVVIDIKSTMTPRTLLPNIAHTKQLVAYQGLMGAIGGGLLYVNRNNCQMSYISQDFDKEEFSNLTAKVTNLAYHEERNSLPMIDETIYEKECKSEYFQCQYYQFCFKDEVS